ncbi:MAG: hypothetical protein HY297_00855 [Thaumarchaeota archaeon]|nr:hypothetical protein [Nitrososphaerota archaeon]
MAVVNTKAADPARKTTLGFDFVASVSMSKASLSVSSAMKSAEAMAAKAGRKASVSGRHPA